MKSKASRTSERSMRTAGAARLPIILLWGALTLAFGIGSVSAAGIADLKPVAPVMTCDGLRTLDLTGAADTAAFISAVQLLNTSAGSYCRVLGTVNPSIHFEIDLPVRNWQQRYLQTGCGGLCGTLKVQLSHAGTCSVALQGGLAVASDDMGHQNVMEPPGAGGGNGAFGADPQKRIDFAYRANHVTALIAKAVIKAFYGQSPRYSYFSGCSDGGREALVEAERYPEDFDGIAAGAPAMNFQVQNSFYHAWQYRANTDASGKHILLADRLPVLHRAALEACDALDGLKDGLISEPRACRFDPAAAQCTAAASDTSNCLTAAEVAVARKLYAGPTDAAGHHFTIGGPQPGSELQWAGVFVPTTADGMVMSQMIAADSSQYLIFPEVSADGGDIAHFAFTEEHFARLATLHALYDATDPDLAAFQKRGNKLLLWHGWSDPHISPLNSIAFYDGVTKVLGASATKSFMRLYLFPGMGHCGGGDGFSQFDILTPLKSWVESGAAPDAIVAAKIRERPMIMGPPPGAGPNGLGGPGFGRMPGGNGAGSGMPPPAAFSDPSPLPEADDTALATRPVYPYPLLTKYVGNGSPNDAANFRAVASPVVKPESFDWEGASFYEPDALKQYAVRDGVLTAVGPVH